MTVYRGLLNFLRATASHEDPKELFVQFVDGRAAIAYTQQDPDAFGEVTCPNGLSFSDGVVVGYGTFNENDVVWGQVVDQEQSWQIVKHWEYEALVETSGQGNFPRSWAYMTEIGMDTRYAPHVIAHVRRHAQTGRSGAWDEYILDRMRQDMPYSATMKPGHHRGFHDQLKTIATEEASALTKRPASS